MNKKSVSLKFLIVGDSGVGKTSLLMRYSQDKFNTQFLSTIGVDFKVKKFDTQTHNFILHIWDTAGQQRFRNITKTFYKGAQGVILVYSIIDSKSFQHITNWIHQVKQNGSQTANMILVGSKCDLQKQRQVPQKLGKQMAEKFNIPFLQTSAKDDKNIHKLFQQFAKDIAKNMKQDEPNTNGNSNTKQQAKKLSKTKQKRHRQKQKCC